LSALNPSSFPDPALEAVKPVIFGCSGPHLTEGEYTFFRYANPFGFILFARNIQDADQVRGLIANLRTAVGRPDAPVFIDQEGGRVLRFAPPKWPAFPAAGVFGTLDTHNPDLAAEALALNYRLLGWHLRQLGVSVNCAPVLDLAIDGATKAIGDRAFSGDPLRVARLGRIAAKALMESGILPVVKHMPGHGRCTVDSHVSLPRVTADLQTLRDTDFMPFRSLKDLPIGMTAHILFEALDPTTPASQSPKIIQDIIRGEIGFQGLLLSDDICMKALTGRVQDFAERAIQAGSDIVLHCNGVMGEMMDVAAALPTLSAEAATRWKTAKASLPPPLPVLDPEGEMERLDMLLGAAVLLR
jgi:beta-N-acetylhexosaminidase